MQIGVAVCHKSQGELKEALLKLMKDTECYNTCSGMCRKIKEDVWNERRIVDYLEVER